MEHNNGISQATAQQARPSSNQSGGYHNQRHGPPTSGGSNSMQQHRMDHDTFPVVYAAHKHGEVNQYKCKYPGCNQV